MWKVDALTSPPKMQSLFKYFMNSNATMPGDCSSVTLTGITDVYTNGVAFLALNKNTGSGQFLGA